MTTTNSLNTYIIPTPAREVTMPLQPAFLAIVDANKDDVTGDGTIYTVAFETERFDQNADYNNGTYTFTAPVTGRYRFTFTIGSHDYAAGHITMTSRLITSNLFYEGFGGDGQAMAESGTPCELAFTFSILCDMDAADTAYVTFTVSGGAKVIDVNGDAAGTSFSHFSGQLEC